MLQILKIKLKDGSQRIVLAGSAKHLYHGLVLKGLILPEQKLDYILYLVFSIVSASIQMKKKTSSWFLSSSFIT